MEFGIFNLMGRRDASASARDILLDTVDLVKIADQGGMGSAWFAEHHFSNYCLCPSPLMMAMYCAAVTQRIKLVSGILVLPLYTPQRLLSEIGMIDSMTDGRLELGLGSGYQPFEFERFGIPMDNTGSMGSEMIELIRKAYADDFVTHEGAAMQISSAHIANVPRGRSAPPMWVAGDSERTLGLAARNGLGLIQNPRFGNADAVVAKRAATLAGYKAAGGHEKDFRFSLLRYCCVTESRREAEDYAENARYITRLAYKLRRNEQVFDGTMLRETPVPTDPTLDEVMGGQMIGDVETCIARGVEEIHKVGPTAISLYFSIGNFCGPKARRSLELFVERVIPGIEKEVGPLKDLPQGPLPAALAIEA